MLRLAPILCLLACVSLLSAPFSTLHMHLAGDHAHDHDHTDDHSLVHWGHVHNLDSHGDSHQVVHAIDLNFAMADRVAPGFAWTDWLPLICVLVVIGLGVPYLILILRPPRPAPRPASRLTYWRPPLRGPPPRSI